MTTFFCQSLLSDKTYGRLGPLNSVLKKSLTHMNSSNRVVIHMFHWEVLFISLQGAGKFFVEVEYSNEFFFRIILIISELLCSIQ